jgi:hypothetical protein
MHRFQNCNLKHICNWCAWILFMKYKISSKEEKAYLIWNKCFHCFRYGYFFWLCEVNFWWKFNLKHMKVPAGSSLARWALSFSFFSYSAVHGYGCSWSPYNVQIVKFYIQGDILEWDLTSSWRMYSISNRGNHTKIKTMWPRVAESIEWSTV